MSLASGWSLHREEDSMPASSTNRRARRSLDRTFKRVSVPARPPAGWARAIREALGMSRPQLASTLGITHQSLAGLEHSEADGSIRLDTLRRLAEAMGCELKYAFVPHHGGLEASVRARAEQVALAELGPVRLTMALEAQEVGSDDDRQMLEDLIAEISDDPRRLWSERRA